MIQDAQMGNVLMLGYMNQEALSITIKTGRVTFYSRTKAALWTKGESSGHFLELIDIIADCDNDALLVLATPLGPTCHKNKPSCFEKESLGEWQVLSRLEAIIAERALDLPQQSYTASLLNEGINKIAQKLGEEGVETVIAALKEDDTRLAEESADLLYHLLVLLRARDLSLADVYAILQSRLAK